MTLFNCYIELWQRRHLISFMSSVRRRGTIFKTLLGRSWYLLNPLAQMLIYYFLVVIVFDRQGIDGVHPFILIATGITHYLFLQNAIVTSCSSIVGNESLLMQIRIEPVTFTAVTFTDALRNFGFMLLVFGAFFAFAGPSLAWKAAFYPFILLLLCALAWICCLIVSTLTVFFRDIQQLSGIVLRILMYLSLVIYPLSFIPEQYQTLYLLNPIACLFALLQWSLLGGAFPPLLPIVSLAVVFVTFLLSAHWIYVNRKDKITKHF
jgi:lipopolysaccharide transport system permease protein